MKKKKIIVEGNSVYQTYFQKTGNSSTHTIAYLKYKDGKLQLMWNTKKGKHFDRLDNHLAEYINKAVTITIEEFELKIKYQKNGCKKLLPIASLRCV